MRDDVSLVRCHAECGHVRLSLGCACELIRPRQDAGHTMADNVSWPIGFGAGYVAACAAADAAATLHFLLRCGVDHWQRVVQVHIRYVAFCGSNCY